MTWVRRPTAGSSAGEWGVSSTTARARKLAVRFEATVLIAAIGE
ncbi:hypothetical protein [Streptomyces sp. CB02261]|nr:hypothetical protein [Streptomyces sp. CB02261]